MLLKQNDIFKSSAPALSGSELWVVTGTAMTGGGWRVGGSYTRNRPVLQPKTSDGHNVDAGAITSEGVPTGDVVSFYQTGGFNGLIPEEEIDIVGVAFPRTSYRLEIK